MAENGVRSTLSYSPLFMLPLKKAIIDGNPVLQWLMPIPVEWLIERDWWCRRIGRTVTAERYIVSY